MSLRSSQVQLLSIRSGYEAEFDRVHGPDVENTLNLVSGTYVVLQLAVKMQDLRAGPMLEALHLLNSACDYLASASVMVRQRARAEAFVLLRSMLDTAMTALAIANDVEAYGDYVEGRLKLKAVMRYAKHALPLLCRFYGQLSEEVVHANRIAYGPRANPCQDGRPFLQVSVGPCRQDSPDKDRVMLIAVDFCSRLLLWTIGQALFEPGLELGYRRLRQSRMQLCGFPTDEFVRRMYQEFDLMVRGVHSTPKCSDAGGDV